MAFIRNPLDIDRRTLLLADCELTGGSKIGAASSVELERFIAVEGYFMENGAAALSVTRLPRPGERPSAAPRPGGGRS